MTLQIKRATRVGVRIVKKPSILGSKNPRWKGGKTIAHDGRVLVYSPNHPNPSKGRYVYRYRLVMEQHIGRFLKRGEVVHHKNHIVNDDRIENLQIMREVEHNQLHAKELRCVGWSRKYKKCKQCKTTNSKHRGRGICTRCADRNRWPRRKK